MRRLQMRLWLASLRLWRLLRLWWLLWGLLRVLGSLPLVLERNDRRV